MVAFGLVLSSVAFCLGKGPKTKTSLANRWPGFLGAGATPLDAKTLPLDWSDTKNVAWTASIPGQGQSSPVIWGDRVFVTSIEGPLKNDCLVLGFDLQTGKNLWQHKVPASQPVRSNYFQSRSAPTPVVDDQRVYAFFETGNLLALTLGGKEVWSRSLTQDYGEFEVRIGLAASLAQNDNSVFVLVDHEGPSYLLAVEKSTGKTIWKTERFSRVSYASPAVLNIGGVEQVVCSSSGSVDGYDVKTGKQLWTYESVGGNTSNTPMAFGDGCFLVGASPGMHNERLEQASQSNLAMQIQDKASGFTPTILWKAEKVMPTFGSPMVYQGYAYWVNRVGVVYCFEAKTGKSCYTKRMGQSIWATPLGVGDRLYFFGKDGETTVIATGPEFRILAKNQLFEPSDPLTQSRKRPEQNDDKEGRQAEPTKDAAPSERRGPSKEETAAMYAKGTMNGLRFADPVQYGYAAVNGTVVVRTGSRLYGLKRTATSPQSNPTTEGTP